VREGTRTRRPFTARCARGDRPSSVIAYGGDGAHAVARGDGDLDGRVGRVLDLRSLGAARRGRRSSPPVRKVLEGVVVDEAN
jgi:hypothetical protein